MVTASYVSPDMAALDAAAKAKGVVILNEVGLDPGIDHLLIMKSIDSIHARGGKVTELVSLCGGLPDPVAADNPLRYKMSWSPRGVLNAAGNSARYLSHGQVINVPGEELLLSTMPTNRIPTLRLEVIPNRDSLSYRELYGVPDVHSICRGTLRSVHPFSYCALFRTH
jgi:saccharopine dehydrogenase-like NADP-dependent oxidoreductase